MSVAYVLKVFRSYEEQRKAKAADPAWAADDGATNYRLEDGQRVMLLATTVADSSTGAVLLGAGSQGVIRQARTPRVMQPKIRKPRTYLYFANVDFVGADGTFRARVPHNALGILR